MYENSHMSIEYEELIKLQIITVMDRILKRRVIDEPFSSIENLSQNPFGARLVPEEIWKGAKFERSFVTSLGQGVFEQIGKIIAEGTGSYATNQHPTVGKVSKAKREKIEQILRELRNSKTSKRYPKWESELEEIRSESDEELVTITINSDLYIKRPSGQEEFYSFKTAKPNIDQTERAKRDMLELWAINEKSKVFFGLPHNPYGEGNTYAYTPPFKIFDMVNDPCVLIGSELWDAIGGEGTYTQLLEIFKEVGSDYKVRIMREYLGIEEGNE